MRKILSFNSELFKVTGVQKVMMDVHLAVKDKYDAKIVGTIPYDQVHQGNNIAVNEYVHWRHNPFAFYNSIVIIHERKYLLFFWILKHILFQKIDVIYVHHNIFNNHRLLSIMPDTVVSISDRSTENLTNYFKVPLKKIHKIHNCVIDEIPSPHKINKQDNITILYPARINDQKRQLDVVKELKGKIDRKIKILFAGDGPLLKQLQELVSDDEQFECLGYRNDITSLLAKCDYILLFSKFEGLSITLLEATMCGVPIITNDVGGNLEIAKEGENAFIANDWNELITVMNNLVNVDSDTYKKMSECSRLIYKDNFTFETFKDKYLNLIEHLQ